MPSPDRRYRRSLTAEQIAAKKSVRIQRSAERQAARQVALVTAMNEGDEAAMTSIAKAITAADRAAAMHRPDASAARRERLAHISERRNQVAWDEAKKINLPIGHDVVSKLAWKIPCGVRDGAKLCAASPGILYEISKCDTPEAMADTAFKAISDAVLIAGGGDQRRHPLHHAVVSGDDRNDLAERALLLMVSAGGDIQRDVFVVVEHSGEGSDQGRHAHIIWIGSRDAGHSGAAVAARAWAMAAGDAGAAQKPSLGTCRAASRDWAAIGKTAARVNRTIESGSLGIPNGAAPGGLFLYKNSWNAGDAIGGETVRGKQKKGAISHVFGRD